MIAQNQLEEKALSMCTCELDKVWLNVYSLIHLSLYIHVGVPCILPSPGVQSAWSGGWWLLCEAGVCWRGGEGGRTAHDRTQCWGDDARIRSSTEVRHSYAGDNIILFQRS